jgi:hypothetical protein
VQHSSAVPVPQAQLPEVVALRNGDVGGLAAQQERGHVEHRPNTRFWLIKSPFIDPKAGRTPLQRPPGGTIHPHLRSHWPSRIAHHPQHGIYIQVDVQEAGA